MGIDDSFFKNFDLYKATVKYCIGSRALIHKCDAHSTNAACV